MTREHEIEAAIRMKFYDTLREDPESGFTRRELQLVLDFLPDRVTWKQCLPVETREACVLAAAHITLSAGVAHCALHWRDGWAYWFIGMYLFGVASLIFGLADVYVRMAYSGYVERRNTLRRYVSLRHELVRLQEVLEKSGYFDEEKR